MFGLLLLEIGARFLPPPFENAAGQADVCAGQTGWRGRPNFQTTVATEDYIHRLALNSRGMHDTEHAQTKPPNTYRILMLGDSFVRAHQVRETETAHQVLEETLNRADDPRRFEVISGGVDGWGTGQQLLYYRQEGRLYQPDLVLLMVYIGNDVTDNLPGRGITLEGRNCYAAYFSLCDGKLNPRPWHYAPGPSPALGNCPPGGRTINNLLGYLYQHSRLYTQLEPLVAARQERPTGLDFYTGQNERFDYALDLTLALIEQLQAEVEADGAEFRVALISPLALLDFARLSPAEREAIYQRLPSMRRAEEIDPPNQFFAAQLARRDIPTLDLYPPFAERMAETGADLHFRADKHWDTTGNRLAGETIAAWLLDKR